MQRIRKMVIGILICFSNIVYADTVVNPRQIIEPHFFKHGFFYDDYKLCKKQLRYCHYQRLNAHCEYNYYTLKSCRQLSQLADYLESSPESISLSPDRHLYYLISIDKNENAIPPYILSQSGDLIKNEGTIK